VATACFQGIFSLSLYKYIFNFNNVINGTSKNLVTVRLLGNFSPTELTRKTKFYTIA